MKVYLDYAAATPLDPRVEKEISKYNKIFGNPSSLHIEGEEARKILENSRKKIAGLLKVRPEELFFTSSGTESVNLAVFGVARANKNTGKHIVTSKIEHFAVLNSCKKLENEGFEVSYADVDKNGIVSPEGVEKLLRKNTTLVSIMHANNEIGAIQPIKEISNVIKKFRRANLISFPYFHTDACQSAGALNTNPHDLGVDLMTINGSKIYGPKSTGCLFARRGVKIEPIIYGGSQEKGLRAGTENSALIAGFAKALEIAQKEKTKNSDRESGLRDYCVKEILKKIPNSCLNGHPVKRLPNNINISFKGVDGEMLVLYLNEKKICVSTGSACTTTETGPSHVIKSLGVPRVSGPSSARWGNIRATLGRSTTKKEIDYFIKFLFSLVKQIRSL